MMNYMDLLLTQAGKLPQKVFLVTETKRLTYEAVCDAALSYAALLQSLSCPKGTLLIVRKDPVAQLTAFLGAQKAGFVPILGHPDLTPLLAETLSKKRGIAYIDDGQFRVGQSGSMVPQGAIMGVLSSGSTDLPKLLFRTYESWADFFPEQCRIFGLKRDSVAFTEGSMSFTGNLSVFASVLYAGASLVMGEGLYPKRWETLLYREGVTYLYLVPVKLKLFLRIIRHPFLSVTTVMAGSQLLDRDTAKALKRAFPHSEIYLYYGATELNYVTYLTYKELLQHPMSVGRPVKGVSVDIRDGLIYIDTPYHVAGLSQPCTLGDEGFFDEAGYLIFLGRKGDVVSIGGLTISCSKVENALLSLPYVSDAIVLSVADRKRDETMAAFLVLKEEKNQSAIRMDLIRKDPVAQLTAFLGAQKAGFVPILGHPDLTPLLAETLSKKRGIAYIDDGQFRVGQSGSMVPQGAIMGVLSSGSTDLPKLLFRTYESWADFFPEQCRIFGLKRDSVAFTEGSMSFTGNLSVFASVLYAGASLVMGEGLYPKRWETLLYREGVTYLYLVPVKLKLFLRIIRHPFLSVTTVMAGSQLLDRDTAKALKRAFPHSEIYLYYGATELNYVTYLTYKELLQHPMSVGRPVKGVSVDIRDGLIYIDTPYHVAGLSQPCTLGDEGFFDEAGYLIFLGRKGDVVSIGGLTISCSKVENALLSLPYVSDAIVLSVADRKRDETMAAFLVLKEEKNQSAIRMDLKTRLMIQEMPRHLIICSELPLTAAGKVDRRALLKMLENKGSPIV